MPRFLMSPPDYYGVEYEINPWMDMRKNAIKDIAHAQWMTLFKTLSSLPDVDIDLIPPNEGLPDMVFTANAGVVSGKRFISSRFRPPQRRGETPYYEQWFEQQEYQILRLPETYFFEGEGDLLRAGRTWFEGYYFRSDAGSHALLSQLLDAAVLPLRLIDPFYYHLDTCFCPLPSGGAVIYPDAFDEYALRVLRAHFPDLIEVSSEEAGRFCCNAVVVDRTVIAGAGCPDLYRALEERGYQVTPLDLSEFIKAGGAAKCLVLKLA